MSAPIPLSSAPAGQGFFDDPFGDSSDDPGERTRVAAPSEELLRLGGSFGANLPQSDIASTQPVSIPNGGFSGDSGGDATSAGMPFDSPREPLPIDDEFGPSDQTQVAEPGSLPFDMPTRPPASPFAYPPAFSGSSPAPAEEDMAMDFSTPFPQGPSAPPSPAGPSEDALMDFAGPPPPSPTPSLSEMPTVGRSSSADDFGLDINGAPPPAAPPPPPASAAPIGFGEVDFGEPAPAADSHKSEPAGPPRLEVGPMLTPAASPSPPPADGLEMLSFIDEAAKRGGAKKGQRYHVRRRNGKVIGPFEEGVVVKMLEEGQLLGNEDVSTDGESWSGVGAVPAFMQAIQKLMSSPAAEKANVPAGGEAADNAQAMERLKHLYEGRMAAPAVVSRPRTGEKLKRKLPLIIGVGVIAVVLAAGLGLGLTRYGVFGLKKIFPAHLTPGTPEFQDVMAARRALLADTYKSYREARDVTAKVLARREFPEARAVWCQAVFYLHRRYAADAPQEYTQAVAVLDEIEMLGAKNVEVAKARAGSALVRKSPAEALLVLQQAKSRPENDGDLELDMLLAEAHAAKGDTKTAQDVLNKVIARDKGSAKALHALGNLHQAIGEADLAAKAYQSALEADPKHVISAVELAAVGLLVRKDIAGGSQAVERALEEQVKSLLGPAELARALALKGMVLSSQFKPKEAIAAFDEALKLDRESTFTKGLLAQALLAQREYDRALPLYKEATTREPKNLEYTDGYLTTLVATGKMEDALNAVSSANTRFPGNARIAYLYGRINDALDSTADAEANYKRAITADPELVDAYLALGRLYLKLKRMADARPQVEQALAKAPDNPGVHAAIADLALTEGDLPRAQQAYNKAVALDPTLAEAHLGLSKVAFATGELEVARIEVDRALEYTVHVKDGRLQRGLVMWKQGQLESAILELTKAKEQDPKSAKIATTLGAVKLEKGDLPGAEASLQVALTSEPSNAEANYYMAVVKARRAEYTQAIENMKKAIEQAPNRPSYHHQMGLILRGAKQLPEAIEEWKVAIQQDPAYADAHEALGQAYLDRGELDSAVKSFEAALKADPKRPRVLGFIGDCYFQGAKWNQAISSYQAALREDSGLASVYYKLGRSYSEVGDQGRAIECFQKATKIEPDNAMPYYYLGFAYKGQGKKNEAMSAFKTYLQKKPDAEDKKEIEDEIYYLQNPQQ